MRTKNKIKKSIEVLETRLAKLRQDLEDEAYIDFGDCHAGEIYECTVIGGDFKIVVCDEEPDGTRYFKSVYNLEVIPNDTIQSLEIMTPAFELANRDNIMQILSNTQYVESQKAAYIFEEFYGLELGPEMCEAQTQFRYEDVENAYRQYLQGEYDMYVT